MKRISNYTKFGMWLKVELLKRNLTQRELAALTGINYRVISAVMTGQNKSHEDTLKTALMEYDKGRV